MALRACGRILRGPIAAFVRRENASSGVRRGGEVCSRAGDGPGSPAARFVTSDAFLRRLEKGRAAEVLDDGFHRHPASLASGNVEQLCLLRKEPDQPESSKILKVAIVGSPNAGKSTLSNHLLGKKVFAVSKKVHTTRRRALGVLTERDTQIILLDTPGLTNPSKVKRHHLEQSLLLDPWNTAKEADLMLVLVDVADKWMCSKLDFEVLKCLARHPDIPAVLVLNKTDLVKDKSKLLEITSVLSCGIVNGRRTRVRPAIKPPRTEAGPVEGARPPESTLGGGSDGALTEPGVVKEQLKALRGQQGWAGFKDVFMISSVDKDDVEALKRYLMVAAKPGAWQYHSEVLTDQTPEDVCTSIVREKLLEYLPQEVPYTLTQSIDFWEENEDGELNIAVKLYAKKDTHMRMVIGTAGQMVARMAREAGEDLSRVFLREVKLKLSVKLRS